MTFLSYSRIQDFNRCKRFYKNKHIDRVEVPEEEYQYNMAMDRGSYIHSLLEFYIKRYIMDEFTSEKLIFTPEMGEVEVVRAWYNHFLDYVAKSGMMEFLKEVPDLKCETDVKIVDKDLDTRFTSKFDITGFDISQGVCLILDWKTGDLKTLEEQNPFQLKLYCYLLWLIYGDKIKWFHIMYCYVDHYQYVDKWYTVEEIKDFYSKELVPKVREIQSEKDFPMNRCGLCQFCSYDGICQREIDRIKDTVLSFRTNPSGASNE